MQSRKLNLRIQFLLGNSSKKISQLSHAKDCILYFCGCYIIFYSPQLDQQIEYIKLQNSKISSITVSDDQKYLAVGQSGKYPQIFIYSIQRIFQKKYESNQPLYILKGHKNSIDLLKFSPNSKYLVSLSNNDGSLFIWQKQQILTKNKISKSVNLLLFDWNQDLITIGRGFIKLWKFDQGQIIRKKQADCWMIQGKVLNFGKSFTSKDFIDASLYNISQQIENNKLILLSSEGFLCIINSKYQKVQKWIDLMMSNTSSLQIYGNLALCAGDNSLIKIIDLVTLSLKGKFPKPPPLNKQNISKDQQLEIKQNQKFPKCLGIMLFQGYILTLYENLTMFVWTMQEQIRAFRSIITHQQKINCVCLLEQIQGDICFFGTASQDNTLRIWHFYKKCFQNNRQSIDIAQIIGIKRNVYCKNLTRIIYTVSEHPIISMKLYKKKFIVCISKQQFLIYSLDNFQLILHQNFFEQFKEALLKNPQIVNCLQVLNQLIYIGFNNGYLRIYKPSTQNLLKLKQIDFGQSINKIKVYDQRKILIQLKNKLIIYDVENNSKNLLNGIYHSNSKDKNIYLAQEKKIIYYSIIKNKKLNQLSLMHQFQTQQKIKLIKSNSIFIVILSNLNRFLIVNLSATIIYSEMMNQQINDLQIAENGELLLVGDCGNIIIKIINNESKYKQLQNRAKKWFQMNDMSWLDNSVWSHSKNNHSSSNIRSKQSTNEQNRIIIQNSDNPLGLQRAKSINFDQILGDQSIKINEKNQDYYDVEYKYKNQQNKMSVFNPSNIYKQANQIYNNVNGLIKNFGNIKTNQNKNIIDFSGSIDQIQFSKSNNQIPKQKRKIFQQSNQFVSKYTNNLVQSQFGKVQQKMNLNQKIYENKVLEQKNNYRNDYDKLSQIKYQKSPYQLSQNQTLQYSGNFTQLNKQENVNNSLKISLSRIKMDKNQDKDDEIIHTFKQIIQVSKYGEQYVDQQYLKNLIEYNQPEFKKIYLVLDKIFGKKQNNQQKSMIKKELLIQEYKKMSQNYLNFMQKNL